jgi:hypothetical protein
MNNRLLAPLILMLIILAGCTPIVGKDQGNFSSAKIPLTAGQTIGQTFVPKNNGLNGIKVHLQTDSGTLGYLQLYLRSEPDSELDLASTHISILTQQEPGIYHFEFQPQSDTQQEYYYLFWEFVGVGTVQFGGAGEGTYLDGALHRNHQPVDQQLAFSLTYEPKLAIWGWTKETIHWLGILSVGIFLFVLPGFALLTLRWKPANESNLFTRICIGTGISLAIYPILFLWTDLLGIHMGALYAWLPPIAGLVILLLKSQDWRRPYLMKDRISVWIKSGKAIPDLSLFVVVSTIFLIRFISIRSIELPMWGDSLQHSMIAQLLVNNRGLFNSWEPFAEAQSFTYHFGFHSFVAVFHWITGTAMPQATLWVGQLLNVFAILSLYPLAQRLGKVHWVGVITLLIAGLFSPMPMTYVNWGRYTQLAGQVVLPIAVYLAWEILDNSDKNWNKLLLGWLLWAGLALTHYRVLIMGVCFIPIVFIFSIKRTHFKALTQNLLLLSLISMLLFLPWFFRILSGQMFDVLQVQTANPANPDSGVIRQFDTIGEISRYLPHYLWILSMLAVLWAILKRARPTLFVTLWWLLILLAANPHWAGVPGTGALRNFTVFIAAYIPTSLVISFVLSRPLQKTSLLISTLILIAMFTLSIFGAIQRSKDVSETQHALITHPDIRAMEWIREQIPSNSNFFVNSFYAYGVDAIVGSDGGWWIPNLTKNSINIPPLISMIEEIPSTDYMQEFNSLTLNLQKFGLVSDEFLTELEDKGFRYIYVGQRQGRVNYGGEHILDPHVMLDSPFFRLLYHEDRVWIFELEDR